MKHIYIKIHALSIMLIVASSASATISLSDKATLGVRAWGDYYKFFSGTRTRTQGFEWSRLEANLDYRHDDIWSAHLRVGGNQSLSFQKAYLEGQLWQDGWLRLGRLESPYDEKFDDYVASWIRENLFRSVSLTSRYDQGVAAGGKIWDGHIAYTASVKNGRQIDTNYGDDDTGLAYGVMLSFYPFAGSDSSISKLGLTAFTEIYQESHPLDPTNTANDRPTYSAHALNLHHDSEFFTQMLEAILHRREDYAYRLGFAYTADLKWAQGYGLFFRFLSGNDKFKSAQAYDKWIAVGPHAQFNAGILKVALLYQLFTYQSAPAVNALIVNAAVEL